MKLTIIGCWGAYPMKNEATSGYLLEEGNTKILLDCGSGVLSCLQNEIGLEELDGVIFSHYHSDHYADLGCLQYAVMLDILTGKRTKSFVAWGPGNEEDLSYKEYCKGYSYLNQSHFQIGDLDITVCENQHEISSYAIKVKGDSKAVLVYSGDTNYYDGLVDFSKKADLLLCEASLYACQKGNVWGHMCSSEAGELAAGAEVSSLCLTHFPHYGEVKNLKEEAGKIYHGAITLAEQGMNLVIEDIQNKIANITL